MKQESQIQFLVFLMMTAAVTALPAVADNYKPENTFFGIDFGHKGLAITEKSPGKPSFVLVDGVGQKLRARGVEEFTVTRTNEKGEPQEVVWKVKYKNIVLSRLTDFLYGDTPAGWQQVVPPAAIKNNQFYLVNQFVYFIRDEKGQYKTYSLAEFKKLCHETAGSKKP